MAQAAVCATPADDLNRALAAAGASNAADARPDQFLQAFSAVIVSVKGRDLPAYVHAAVQARPDLASRLVIMALRVQKLDRNPVDRQLASDILSRIITAAVSAAPDMAPEIVKAALSERPDARAIIIAAAIKAAPGEEVAIRGAADEMMMVAFQFSNAGPINPVDVVVGPVTSPEQPPSGP